MKSDLASKIEEVFSTGKYRTIANDRPEKMTRPKSSYVRAS